MLGELTGKKDLADLEEAVERARDTERLLEDLTRAGRDDWAQHLRVRRDRQAREREKSERDFAGVAAWVTRLVADHRPVFRWAAFYDGMPGRPLVRLLLGVLLADRMGLIQEPAQEGPGRPSVVEVTLPLLTEVLLFPAIPRREEALAAHVPDLPCPTPRGILDAARTALELSSWGSPREPIVRALEAAGHTWATVYLGAAPPGAKHRHRALHQAQVRNARTRASKTGQYGGPEALLHAAAVPLLKTGTVGAVQRHGRVLAILVPGVGALHRPLP